LRRGRRYKQKRGMLKGLTYLVLGVGVLALLPWLKRLIVYTKTVQVGITAPYTENAASQDISPQVSDSMIDFSSLLPKVESAPQVQSRPAGAKDIKTVDLSPTGGIAFGSTRIKNGSELSAAAVKEILQTKSDVRVDIDSDAPQVLIVHTHTTECYEQYDLGYYLSGSPTRTKDSSKNMVRVGQEIAKTLNAAGINTVQDTRIHDLSYNDAYNKSRAATKEYLEKYPSIKIVLDVHRDAITYSDGSRGKPTATINGKKAAQMMVIVGCNGSSTPIPNYKKNLRFGAALTDAVEKKYPGLMRSVLFRYSFYNQDLTTGSILVEMGSVANTLGEAVYSGQLLGQAMAEYLKSL